jgi:hypothetical protein
MKVRRKCRCGIVYNPLQALPIGFRDCWTITEERLTITSASLKELGTDTPENPLMNYAPGFLKSFAWSSLLWIGACAGAAQTHPASPAEARAIISPAVQAPAQEGSAVPAEVPARRQTNSTSRDRLFFALPNFLTLEKSARVRPITAAQKFQVTARSAFDPLNTFGTGH